MIIVGIYDGDLIVVEQMNYAENGDIVVALVDGESATVKTFYKEDGHFRLQPENDSMEPIIADDVEILGKVRALLRYF
jgi:repressor LexA